MWIVQDHAGQIRDFFTNNSQFQDFDLQAWFCYFWGRIDFAGPVGTGNPVLGLQGSGDDGNSTGNPSVVLLYTIITVVLVSVRLPYVSKLTSKWCYL